MTLMAGDKNPWQFTNKQWSKRGDGENTMLKLTATLTEKAPPSPDHSLLLPQLAQLMENSIEVYHHSQHTTIYHSASLHTDPCAAPIRIFCLPTADGDTPAFAALIRDHKLTGDKTHNVPKQLIIPTALNPSPPSAASPSARVWHKGGQVCSTSQQPGPGWQPGLGKRPHGRPRNSTTTSSSSSSSSSAAAAAAAAAPPPQPSPSRITLPPRSRSSLTKEAALTLVKISRLPTPQQRLLAFRTLLTLPGGAAQPAPPPDPEEAEAEAVCSEYSQEENNIRRALKELGGNHISRALQALSSKGVLPLNPEVRAKLASKYPHDNTFIPPAQPPSNASVPTLHPDSYMSIISQAVSTKGPGDDGWSWAHLQDIQALAATNKHGLSSKDVAAGIATICADISMGYYTTKEADMWDALSTARGIPLVKAEGSTDPRPVGIPPVWVSLAFKAILQSPEVTKYVTDHHASLFGEWQLGCNTPGGVEAIANIIRSYLALHPERAALQGDIKNAFNQISRSRILELGQHLPQIAPLLHLLYCKPGGNKVVYRAHDGSEPLTLHATMGTTQGGVEAGMAYNFAHRPAVANTLAAHPTLTCTALHDDTYMMDHPLPLLTAMNTYKAELAKLGETLQLNKCKLLLGPQVPAADMPAIMAQAAALGVQIVDGFTAGGIPVGTVAHVEKALTTIFTEADDTMGLLRRAIASISQAPSATSIQGIYKILRWCMAPAKVNHLLRGLPANALKHHIAKYDQGIFQLLTQLLNLTPSPALDTNTLEGTLLLDKCHLPAKLGGLGLGSAVKTADAARRGNLALTASIVATALSQGGQFDAERDGKTALPELYTLFDPAVIAPLGIQSMPGSPPSSYFQHQCRKISRLFNIQDNALLQKRILARMTSDPQGMASFLSSGGEGATYLLTTHAAGKTLTSPEFIALARTRLGLPATNTTPTSPTCMHCGLDADSRGLHILECRRGKPQTCSKECCEDSMGEFKAGGRHGAVRTVLLKTMTSILHRERPGTATVMQHEPYVTQHLTWVPKAPPGQQAHSDALKRRADIGYTLHEPDKPPIIKGVDLVITHANPRRSSGPEAANFPGIAALKVHELKIKSYDKDFVVPVGRLIPFAVETGGRLSTKSRLFLATFVRKDAMGLATEDGMSAEERTKYNAYLRELIEAVGITLAKATAGALLWNSGGRLPCPKTAVRASSALPLTGVDEEDSSDTEAVEALAAAGSQ